MKLTSITVTSCIYQMECLAFRDPATRHEYIAQLTFRHLFTCRLIIQPCLKLFRLNGVYHLVVSIGCYFQVHETLRITNCISSSTAYLQTLAYIALCFNVLAIVVFHQSNFLRTEMWTHYYRSVYQQ